MIFFVEKDILKHFRDNKGFFGRFLVNFNFLKFFLNLKILQFKPIFRNIFFYLNLEILKLSLQSFG